MALQPAQCNFPPGGFGNAPKPFRLLPLDELHLLPQGLLQTRGRISGLRAVCEPAPGRTRRTRFSSCSRWNAVRRGLFLRLPAVRVFRDVSKFGGNGKVVLDGPDEKAGRIGDLSSAAAVLLDQVFGVLDLIENGLLVGDIERELPGLPLSYTSLHQFADPGRQPGLEGGPRLGIDDGGKIRAARASVFPGDRVSLKSVPRAVRTSSQLERYPISVSSSSDGSRTERALEMCG